MPGKSGIIRSKGLRLKRGPSRRGEAPALDVGTCILTASYAAAKTGETVSTSGEIAAPAEGCSGDVV